jgi:hypothetical protein
MFAITASEGSVTFPTMLPRKTCAFSTGVHATTKNATRMGKNGIFDQLPRAYPRCRLVLAADSMQLRRCARFFRKKRRPTQCVHRVGQTRSKEILSKFLFELCCIHCCVPTWRTIRATTTSIGRLIHKFNLTNKPNIVNLRETAQGNPSIQHICLQ